MKFFYSAGLLLAVGLQAFAQDPVKLSADVKDTVIKKVAAAKTNTSWDIISDFYQLSLNDITGTSKALTFGATLNAISQAFKPPVVDHDPGRFANNFQPVLVLGYKNNFQNLNSSIGFKYALFNQTDAKYSNLLNNNEVLLGQFKDLQDYAEKFIAALRADHKKQLNDPKVRAALIAGLDSNSAPAKTILDNYRIQLNQKLKSQLDQITALEKNASAGKLTPDLKKEFDSIDGIHTVGGLVAKDSIIRARMDDIARTIANGWNIAINPMVTYDITGGGFQGLNLGATGSKGFRWFNEDKYHTSQFIGKFNYVVGTDSIVTVINTTRKQITDQLGFNQVIGTSINKSVSKTDPTPSFEASVTGSYNYVFSGLKKNEKNAQPALNLKFGVLVGKSTWLTLPLSYNFAAKTGMALLSLQVNVGPALF